MTRDPGGIRNIERIEEDDDERRTPRGVVIAFVVLGGACIVFAVMALGGRGSRLPVKKSDPLGELLMQRSRAEDGTSTTLGGRDRELGAAPPVASGPSPTELSPKDVTFPQRLSDNSHPPTALAALHPVSSSAPAPAATQPPPPTDRLSVVPLPAQAVLEATPIVTRPRDAMTKAASEAAKMDSPALSNGAAAAGHEGGYQLQVSSFHTQGEAQAFADQLRARGHKAYVVEANVPGRGTWYRVRVGPFASQHAAAEYRADFEDREHVVPFIVIPDMTAKAR
jgi:cell division septation protein DedD